MFLPPCRSIRLTVTAMSGDLDPFILMMVRDTSLRDIALCLNVDLNLIQAMTLARYGVRIRAAQAATSVGRYLGIHSV